MSIEVGKNKPTLEKFPVRLLQAMTHINISARQLCLKAGLSDSIVRKIITGHSVPNMDTVSKILAAIEDEIDPIWLLTGRGSMLFQPPSYNVESSTNDFAVFEPPASYGDKPPIRFVSEKAFAGWAAQGQAADWFWDSPSVSIPGPANYSDSVQVCIQVEGSSMEPTISNGDYIIASQVTQYRQLRGGEIYVFVTSEGILIKRLGTIDASLTLLSDNASYAPAQVPLADIYQAWRCRAKISYNLASPL